MLTVRELITESELIVLAGQGGLDRPVRWVHSSELADPTRWLSGGEVLLSTGMNGLSDPAEQAAYIHRLADHELAGLGIGLGFVYDAIPEAMVAAAVERDFPLFAVPYDMPFIAITEAAFSRLVNDQYALLRRALAAQERLERIVLSQQGLAVLAEAMAGLLGARILVIDRHGETMAAHGSASADVDAEAEAALARELAERSRRRQAHPFRPSISDSAQVIALPVAAEATGSGPLPPEAWLVAMKDTAVLSDFDRLLLRQAVTIVGLELLRSRVADATERRLAGDVLSAVLSGELTSSETVRRLAPFGLADRVAVLVSGVRLDDALAAEGERALVAPHGQLVCALVRGRDDDELFELAGRVAAHAGVVVGAGRTIGVERSRRAFHEARCAYESVALNLGTGTGTGSAGVRAATYRDLGSSQLLLSLQDDAALALFCDSVLGAIDRSEGHYGGELIRSLEAFIEENGQWERAAKRLYCHRHTLRYRIKRAEELTGRDLSSARDRIDIWLALRGRELIA